jgi:hypothetical protein
MRYGKSNRVTPETRTERLISGEYNDQTELRIISSLASLSFPIWTSMRRAVCNHDSAGISFPRTSTRCNSTHEMKGTEINLIYGAGHCFGGLCSEWSG